MGERALFSEIKRAYPNEWVLLRDPLIRNNDLVDGEMMFHSPDGDLVADRAVELKLKSSALVFTGPPIPPGVDYWLQGASNRAREF